MIIVNNKGVLVTWCTLLVIRCKHLVSFLLNFVSEYLQNWIYGYCKAKQGQSYFNTRRY